MRASQEFRESLPLLKKWDILITDPEKTFQEMDKNNGGSLLFDEFSHYILGIKIMPAEAKKAKNDVEFDGNKNRPSILSTPLSLPIDWDNLAKKMPSDKNDEDRKKRGKLFDGVDVNGNGYLSLAEVDKGMRDVLGCSQLFDCKPAMMRAFQAAKASVKTKSKLGADYVERCEFRLLLMYLKKYFELFQLFRTIDASSDRRISKEEFGQSIDLLEKWGLDTKGRSAEAMFAEIDTDKGGMLLFDEISRWALREKLAREGEDDDGGD